MKDWLGILRASVNLDDYTSSSGFLGRFEPSSGYRRDLIGPAVDVLHKSLGACSLLVTSLYVPTQLEWLIEDHGIADAEIEKFIAPLLSTDLVRSIDLDAYGDDYESRDYQDAVAGLALEFRNVNPPAREVLLGIAEAVMGVGGIKGHFFQIYSESGLIVYPHDDVGFGFIGPCEEKPPVVLEDLVRRLPAAFRFMAPVER